MAQATFSLYRIDRLGDEGHVYQTPSRSPVGAGAEGGGLTFTRLDMRAPRRLHGYREATLEHRDVARVDGLWNDQFVHRVVRVTRFPVYYRRETGLFLAGAGNTQSRAATRKLNQELPDQVRLVRIDLDLTRLLNALPEGTPVHAAWSTGRSDSPVRTRAIFGEDVSPASEFDEMRRGLTSVTLSFPFGGPSFKVRVTRSGSVTVLEQRGIRDCLLLVEHLAGVAAPTEATASGRAAGGKT